MAMAQKIFFLRVIALSASSIPTLDITGPALTTWGDYGDWGECPSGFYVYGMRLSVEKEQGTGDDTALNDIELLCRQYFGGSGGVLTLRNSNKIRHLETVEVPRSHGERGGFGEWRDEFICPENREAFVTGIQLKIESPQGAGDDTAANDVKLICSNGDEVLGNGSPWGEWQEQMICPQGLKVCGMRTKIEKNKGPGIEFENDDTTLNTIDIRCC